MGPPIKLKKNEDEEITEIHYEQKLRSLFFENANSEGLIPD